MPAWPNSTVPGSFFWTFQFHTSVLTFLIKNREAVSVNATTMYNPEGWSKSAHRLQPHNARGPVHCRTGHPSTRYLRLLGSFHSLVESFRNVVDVVRVETCHGDTSVLGHIYV